MSRRLQRHTSIFSRRKRRNSRNYLLHIAIQEILQAHATGSYHKRTLRGKCLHKLGQAGIHSSAATLHLNGGHLTVANHDKVYLQIALSSISRRLAPIIHLIVQLVGHTHQVRSHGTLYPAAPCLGVRSVSHKPTTLVGRQQGVVIHLILRDRPSLVCQGTVPDTGEFPGFQDSFFQRIELFTNIFHSSN